MNSHFFVNRQLIYYLFREFTTNSLSLSQIHYQFTFGFAISLYFSRIYYKFIISFANSLSIHFLIRDNTIFSVNSLLIQYVFRKFTLIALFLLRNHYKNTIFFSNMLYKSDDKCGWTYTVLAKLNGIFKIGQF